MPKMTLPSLSAHTLFFVFLFIAFNSLAQSPGEKLKSHQDQYPLEKVYIAQDRSFYAPGDTIWCQAYLVEGRSHLPFANAPVLHVDWYNEAGECLQSYLLKVKNGTAAFEIPTSAEDSSGIFYLRVYTQYQRNFDPAYLFQRPILLTRDGLSAPKTREADDFSLQFFPEGGYTIRDCPGTVAFLATNTEGKPIPVEGLLQETNGKPIRAIKAVHEGMGTFSYTPLPGKSYEVNCNYKGQEKTFPLPASLPEGYQLSVKNRAEEYFEFSVLPSPGLSLEGLQIVGHLRGQVFLDEVIEESALYGKRIPRTALPSGLIQLTLFDQQNRPVAERLLFNRNASEDVRIQIEKNQQSFAPRTNVELDINTLRAQEILPSRFSLSVYNHDLFPAQKEGLNIQSHLWLQSDLAQFLPDPHQYLQENSNQSRLLLDYVLMTRGWRRFNWQEVLTQPLVINYSPQEHIAIAGKVLKRGKPVKAEVFLNILNEADFTSVNLTTQEDGLFLFNGFDFTDSTELVLQANEHNSRQQKKRKKEEAKPTGNRNVDIERIDLNEIPFQVRPGVLPILVPRQQVNYAQEIQRVQTAQAAYRDMLIQEIEAMEVTGSRLSSYQEKENELKAEYRELGIPYTPQARKFFTDDLNDKGQRFPDIYEMIGAQFPGVTVDRQEPLNKKILFNNRNDGILTRAGYAILVVDGMIIDQNLGNTPPPILPLDVKNISLYPAIQASTLFGERARGGAVVILTRKEPVQLGDQSLADRKGTLSFTHPGYYQARTFFSPTYSQSPRIDRPDLRSTQLSFYTGDQTGTFTIQIEGISSDGLPFVHWEEIEVVSK